MSIFALEFLRQFMGALRLFYGCFYGTSRLFQEFFDVIFEFVMGVLRLFLSK